MGLARFIILDVAHGNCTLIEDNDAVYVIDCAPGATLLETLDVLGIEKVSYVLLSHADEDHIGGVMSLLLGKKVDKVYVNCDSVKRSEVWQDMRYALANARKTGNTRVHPALTTNESDEFRSNTVKLEILAPYPEDALGGVGGRNIDGRRQSHNTMSAVIRVIHQSHPIALLPGDMDRASFERIQRDYRDLTADIVVFPHHGGRSGSGDMEKFASELCHAVSPQLVVFSIGRGMKGFPRSEVIKGVLDRAPSAHVCCTQLSQDCASTNPDSDFEHLAIVPAKGKDSRSCCGGSLLIELRGEDTSYSILVANHSGFIDNHVPSPICRIERI
jgi:competence protein ComEC